MTDLLIATFGFLLAYQAGALVTAFTPRRIPGTGALLTPLLFAVIATLAFLIPHEIGERAGAGHAVEDLDSHLPGVPAAWVMGLLAFFGVRTVLRLGIEARTAWRLHVSRVAPSPALERKLRRVRDRLAALAPSAPVPAIRLHRSAAPMSPFVRGLMVPTIHLDAGLAEALSDEHLAAILLHETAHRLRCDPWMAMLYSVVLSVLDLGGAGRRRWQRWRERAEFACDDFAAARLGAGLPVAEAIVAVLRFGTRPMPSATGTAFCSEDDAPRRRVRRLLARGRAPAASDSATWRPVAAGVLLLVLTASVCYREAGLTVFCLLEHAVGVHCVD